MSSMVPKRRPLPTGTPGDPALGRRVLLGAAARPWTLIVLACFVLFAIWAASTRTQPHHVKAAFPSAVSLVPGLDVQANGVDVGKISSVEYKDGQAIVGLGIKDERLWPLHRGTTATIRYGTTAGNGTRRIDLVPGPPSAPEIEDGGIIAVEDTGTPVEFDEIFRMMDRDTRGHMRSLVGRTAETLDGRSRALNEGIRETGPALEAAGGLLGDLADDDDVLRALIANAHRTTSTLDARKAQISDLVTVAAQTFREFGANTRAVGAAIHEAPRTLHDARSTLARLDGSVERLTALVRDAAPGAAELPGLAADARPAVRELAATAPVVSSLLRTGRAAAPDVTPLLDKGVPFAKRLTPILNDLAPMFGCLRPYSPEIAGAMSTWAGYGQNYDGYGHYARMRVIGGPTSVTSQPETRTSDITKATGIRYAMPRPPGLNAGQPWLLPECGVGADALDPTKDPEDRK
ncbi:MAG TPA: MlaD family protein [Baekduia sp.]|nr:MlaD family protein [Baekduia sp.]